MWLQRVYGQPFPFLGLTLKRSQMLTLCVLKTQKAIKHILGNLLYDLHEIRRQIKIHEGCEEAGLPVSPKEIVLCPLHERFTISWYEPAQVNACSIFHCFIYAEILS